MSHPYEKRAMRIANEAINWRDRVSLDKGKDFVVSNTADLVNLRQFFSECATLLPVLAGLVMSLERSRDDD